MTKKLIVNADDYQLTQGCNAAIETAIVAGAVTSASAIVWNRDSPRSKLSHAGVHLRLTDGYPLLSASEVPSLIEPGGWFPKSQQAVAMRNVDQREVYLEWSAQISKFIQSGGCATHLDTHRHTHALLNLQDVYAQLCVEFQLAGVPLSWRQRDNLRSRGVACADFTEICWLDGEAKTLETLLDEDFRRHETVWLMTHPGYNDPALAQVSTMTEVRRREFDVLMSSRFKEWRERQRVELIGPEDLAVPTDPLAKIDIIFLTWNRKRFTEEALLALKANTDWSRVRRLFIFDDGSTDGTLTLVRAWAARSALDCTIMDGKRFGSPVAIMNEYLTNPRPSPSDFRPTPWFAKIDSDTIVPPGWLPECIRVLRNDPSVDLLGIEAKYPPVHVGQCKPGGRGTEPTDHIGGIGLMRTAPFLDQLPEAHGRMGFSDWQIKQPVRKAWLNPALPVILLDRLPMEPWSSLSAKYEAEGWQRPWARYTSADAALWDWWTK